MKNYRGELFLVTIVCTWVATDIASRAWPSSYHAINLAGFIIIGCTFLISVLTIVFMAWTQVKQEPKKQPRSRGNISTSLKRGYVKGRRSVETKETDLT